MILSGEYPELLGGVDIMKVNDTTISDRFVNVLDYLDYMPNFKKVLERYPDLKFYQPKSGVMYALPLDIADEEAPRSMPQLSWLIRQDILEKHGLKVPETQDEFYELLKELKRLYPDSSPFATRSTLTGLMEQFGDAWGITIVNGDMIYDEATGTFSWIGDSKVYREMIQFIDKLYKEGLLDNEFLIPNVTQWQESMISGRSFFTIDWMSRADRFNTSAREMGNTEYKMVSMLPPKFGDGNRTIRPKKRANTNMVLSSRVDNPEIYLKFLDYWLYSKDGSILTNMGIEGKTFKWLNDEKTQWDYVGDEEFPNPTPTDYNVKYGIPIDISTGIRPQVFGIEEKKFDDQYQKDVELYNGHFKSPAPIMLWNEEEADFMWEMSPQFEMREKVISSILIGEATIEAWDAYVAEVGNEKMRKAVQIYNENWARRK